MKLVDDNDVHNIEEYAPNKKCLDCDKSYCDYKNKEVKKKCRICKCNEHGCQQRVYNVTSKGDTWLCGDCMKLTNLVERKHPNLFENLRKTLMRKNTQSKKTKSNHNKTSVNKDIEVIENKESVCSRAPISLFDIVFQDEDLQSLNEGE